MDQFAKLTGRAYHLFDYEGHPEAERVIVVMGSGAETAAETAAWLNANGEKTGVLKVRLYRPFSVKAFAAALPRSVKVDRRPRPHEGARRHRRASLSRRHRRAARGRTGGMVHAARRPVTVIGGRYGLSSKEFTPPWSSPCSPSSAGPQPKNPFTIGINDDVTGLSLPYDAAVDIEPADRSSAVFFGLGSDGTVGANKNTIKIIGEEAGKYAQAYFVYDSKKSGAVTISHLRFGDRLIRAPYLVHRRPSWPATSSP